MNVFWGGFLQPPYENRNSRSKNLKACPFSPLPQDLVVEQGTLLHFQWTGSDANNNGHLGDERKVWHGLSILFRLSAHYTVQADCKNLQGKR